MGKPVKQPSGKWQGVAFHPSGRRVTKVWPLKRQAQSWADELEREWARGGAHANPRAGDQTVGDWIAEWREARRADPVTLDKEASHLRTPIVPRWEAWPLNSVRRLDVQAWVKDMEAAGVGPHTIYGAVRLFSMVMGAAAEERRISANPAARIKLPTPPVKPPFFWTREQGRQIVAATAELSGTTWATAIDLDLHVGLRLGELLGLRVGAVDWAGQMLSVVGVQTRHGWRAHPKSKRSARVVPIPGHLMDALAPLVIGRPAEAPVFPAPAGGLMDDHNFRARVFEPALRAAGVPRGVPHDMRHTAASWLVQAGRSLYEVQDLLGHESLKTTQRYSHLAPDRHAALRDVWAQMALSPEEGQ